MNTKRHSLTLLVALLVTMQSATVFGKTFKWVDAHGGIHYTQVPPTEPGARILEVTGSNDEPKQPRKQTGTNDKPTEHAATDQTKPTRYNVLVPDEKEAEEARKAEELRKRQQEEACNALRNNLKILRQNSRIRIRSSEGEEPRVLTPEEREERIRQYSENLDKMCK